MSFSLPSSLTITLALSLALAALRRLPQWHAELTAGAANADITPPIGTPMFAYTARSAIAFVAL